MTRPKLVLVEKTEFTVVLTDFDPDPHWKIMLIKEVREITGLGIADALNLVEGAPKPVKEGVSKDDAAKIKRALENVGGKVEIR